MILTLMIIVMLGFIGWTVFNVESMKSSPLEYAEKKYGGDCMCYCSNQIVNNCVGKSGKEIIGGDFNVARGDYNFTKET